jgi:hypothetical protein
MMSLKYPVLPISILNLRLESALLNPQITRPTQYLDYLTSNRSFT